MVMWNFSHEIGAIFMRSLHAFGSVTSAEWHVNTSRMARDFPVTVRLVARLVTFHILIPNLESYSHSHRISIGFPIPMEISIPWSSLAYIHVVAVWAI